MRRTIDFSGEYPVLKIEFDVCPKTIALLSSCDPRQRKRGWRLAQKQINAVSHADGELTGIDTSLRLSKLLDAAGYYEERG